MTDSMIFHHPHPLRPEGGSGSQVRPVQMLEGFRQLGFDIEVVAGYGPQRAKAIHHIKQQIAKGRQFRFAYSESSTSPTLLTEPNHNPLYALSDFEFLGWLHKKRIPIGLFYRDIHWKFPFYRKRKALWKRTIAVPLYWYDWLQYLRCIDTLFLPSLEMARYLPTKWHKSKVEALPPGCHNDVADCQTLSKERRLRLFYVGSIDPITAYNLTPMIESMQGSDDVHLVLCCPSVQWKRHRPFYSSLLDTRVVKIIHESGEAIKTHYKTADAFCLIWNPVSYLDFAMPIKLFEAIGYGLPIIANRGTLAAKFIEDEGIGWVMESTEELKSFYHYLNNNRHILEEKKYAVRLIRKKHTWVARAKMAAEILSAPRHTQK